VGNAGGVRVERGVGRPRCECCDSLMAMMYQQITTDDPEYQGEKALRQAVLRKPLGLSLSAEDTRDDAERIHLVAIDSGKRVVGCVLMTKEEEVARIRQMAVDEEVRTQGIGSELIQRIECIAMANGCTKTSMHARCQAQRFYEKLGYQVISSVFQELGIPHVIMEKRLDGEAPNERS